MAYILIKVMMRNKIGGKIVVGKSIIKDGVSLTTYDDPRITQRSFKAMKKKGKDCSMDDGVLIEYYPGLEKGEIAKKIETDLKNLGEKFKRIMDIDYTRKVVK